LNKGPYLETPVTKKIFQPELQETDEIAFLPLERANPSVFRDCECAYDAAYEATTGIIIASANVVLYHEWTPQIDRWPS
jgi:hypothetical protein